MEALLRRLTFYADLRDADLDVIAAISGREESYSFGEDIVSRGDVPMEAFVVIKGWAARYVTLEDGRSQVLNFMLPGDVYDLQVFVANGSDHSISALNNVTVYTIPRRQLLSVFESGTRAGAAFWWCALQEEAILREQIVRNGRRSARERVAHLILELHRRAVIAGEGAGETFRLPVSQAILADALGLSFVHVNRVLGELSKFGCISRSKGQITLLDRDRMIDISGFQEDYLHLKSHPRRLVFETLTAAYAPGAAHKQ